MFTKCNKDEATYMESSKLYYEHASVQIYNGNGQRHTTTVLVDAFIRIIVYHKCVFFSFFHILGRAHIITQCSVLAQCGNGT